MEGHGQARLLGDGPEAVVAGVTVGDAVDGVTTEKNAPGPELGRPLQFVGPFLGVRDGDVGNWDEAVGVVAAEVDDPVVVDATVGGGELVVGAFGFPGESHCWVQD